MGERLVGALPLGKARAVLDVGAGVGALLPAIRAAAPRATIVGIDRSEGMLRVAQANSTIPLAVMDASRQALRPSSFDVAVLAFVLFHFADPIKGLVEVASALRPGGTVGTITWGEEPPFPAARLWDEELDGHGAASDPIYQRAQDELMDTPEKVTELFEQAGFASIRAWPERWEHRWSPEQFFALRTRYGSHRRRLESLEPDVHAVCLARVHEKWAHLSPEDFVYRPEVIFGVACVPPASDARPPGP
jgi:ubiquinone/menaquinone biosynthesis C-methylase UbiE